MSCRVERVADGGTLIVFRVTGRIQRAHIQMLREVLERESGRLALDLEEVTLVDREIVRFLAFSEENGVELKYVPDYLREWVTKERAEISRQRNPQK
jgi:hypothetical protein